MEPVSDDLIRAIVEGLRRWAADIANEERRLRGLPPEPDDAPARVATPAEMRRALRGLLADRIKPPLRNFDC